MKTTAVMKYIPATQISANRRRNFALNPLRAEQITALVESYHATARRKR